MAFGIGFTVMTAVMIFMRQIKAYSNVYDEDLWVAFGIIFFIAALACYSVAIGFYKIE
jgi:choline-glycine betaine transporter